MKRTILILSCLFLFAQASFAQVGAAAKKPPPDPRVKVALDQIGYKFELTDDNDYKLVPIQTEQSGTTADGKPIMRSQLVYVNSNVEKYGTLEIREVLAPAFLSNGPLSAAIANRLLRENNSVKLGSWRLVAINSGANAGKYLAMYAAQIAADSDAESLRLTIKSVILIADRMEKELTGLDDY
ncbi:MAG TPA: hypothetical protein VM095_11065 [Pyrinomonadaceae bacterium]|jgi:hypothetical protein|nr:hypothetical protein [Pyrinomonadaceae bacterium]